MRCQQTHNQGFCQLFLKVDCDLRFAPRAPHLTRQCFSVVPEAMYESSRGPLKGAVLAQKALQGYEMETMELPEGKEENSVSPMRGHLICPTGKLIIFYLSGPPNI